MNGAQVLMVLFLLATNSVVCSGICPMDCICLSQTQVIIKIVSYVNIYIFIYTAIILYKCMHTEYAAT